MTTIHINNLLRFIFIVFLFANSGLFAGSEKGVSRELANLRSKTISSVNYDLSFNIPESLSEKIDAELTCSFNLSDISTKVIMDFKVRSENLQQLVVNNIQKEIKITDGHICIDQSLLIKGKNIINIKFVAGELSLNRNGEFLYTLLVPDRASTVFPCFDQPDIKANFKLSLTIPAGWIAVSNAPLISNQNNRWLFDYTEPLSTYLFSFTAGKFNKSEKEIAGRKFHFYYREKDKNKIENNLESIFELHNKSLVWLEEYTGVKYPFAKFDFVAIPSFQYSGMEHPGNIYYNESKLFLENNPSQNQLLERASLIAHETAHIWFGDYVTMQWFDDVWLKEVFANFMAGKIVNPSFPKIDHQLKFLYANIPAAYSVDRTGGTHPIKQKLENMLYAGTLYGPIIYQKSPVVMKQLEEMIGENKFRDAVKDYMNFYKYGNADWKDLAAIFDKHSGENISEWSDNWIMQEGRPEYSFTLKTADNKISSLEIIQSDPGGRNRVWKQSTEILLGYKNEYILVSTKIKSKITGVESVVGKNVPDFILLNGKGSAYGNFKLDKKTIKYLHKNISEIKDDLIRGNAWLNLYEELLNKNVKPAAFLETCLNSIRSEENPLIFDKLRSFISFVYNNCLSKNEQKSLYPKIVTQFKTLVLNSTDTAKKKSLFRSYYTIASDEKELTYIFRIWSKDTLIKGMDLTEDDFINLAFNLRVKNYQTTIDFIKIQEQRITNIDKLEKFRFIVPALSSDQIKRDEFFNSLFSEKNREHESWVTEALEYLHHPVRTSQSVKYLPDALGLLEEIQRTGDIFFPQRWLGANFTNHTSVKAKNLVAEFLRKNPNLDYRLKNKILQSTDILFRFAK